MSESASTYLTREPSPFSIEDNKENIKEAFRILKENIGLKDYSLSVLFDTLDESLAMNCLVRKGSNHINITVNSSDWNYSIDSFIQKAIHELIHAHVFQLSNFANDYINQLAPSQTVIHFYQGFEQHEEMFVDRLATALTPFLSPLVYHILVPPIPTLKHPYLTSKDEDRIQNKPIAKEFRDHPSYTSIGLIEGQERFRQQMRKG